MAPMETIDQYIEQNYQRWLDLSKTHLGRPIDPREGGYHLLILSDQEVSYRYSTISLAELVDTIKSLMELQRKPSEITSDEIAHVFSRSDTLKHTYEKHSRIHQGDWHSIYEQNLEYGTGRVHKELTQAEKNAAMIDAVLHQVLGISNNYQILIFGTDEHTFDKIDQAADGLFKETEGYSPVKRSSGASYMGKLGRSLSVDKSGYVYGTGGANITLFEEGPQNKLLVMWYGTGIGGADFVLKLAGVIESLGYSAHFNAIGANKECTCLGTFHDPAWKPI